MTPRHHPAAALKHRMLPRVHALDAAYARLERCVRHTHTATSPDCGSSTALARRAYFLRGLVVLDVIAVLN
jgi:hypothetical protein